MPFFYSTVPTADVATSASANTSVDHLRTLTVGRDAALVKLDLVGKGAAQSTITGIEARSGANGNADVLSQTEGTVALSWKYTLGHREL